MKKIEKSIRSDSHLTTRWMGKHPVFDKKSVFWAFTYIMIPTLIASILTVIYKISDNALAEKLIGSRTHDIDSVKDVLSRVSPIVLSAEGFVSLITIGSTVYFGIAIGKKEKDKAYKVFNSALLVGVVLSLVISFLGMFISDWLVNIQKTPAPEGVISESSLYVKLIFAGLAFKVTFTLIAFTLQAEGKAWLSFIILALPPVINIGLSAIMMGPAHLGVSGSGYASLISWFIGLIVAFTILFMVHKKKNTWIYVSIHHMSPSLKIIVPLLLLGLSPLLRNTSELLSSSMAYSALEKMPNYDHSGILDQMSIPFSTEIVNSIKNDPNYSDIVHNYFISHNLNGAGSGVQYLNIKDFIDYLMENIKVLNEPIDVSDANQISHLKAAVSSYNLLVTWVNNPQLKAVFFPELSSIPEIHSLKDTYPFEIPFEAIEFNKGFTISETLKNDAAPFMTDKDPSSYHPLNHTVDKFLYLNIPQNGSTPFLAHASTPTVEITDRSQIVVPTNLFWILQRTIAVGSSEISSHTYWHRTYDAITPMLTLITIPAFAIIRGSGVMVSYYYGRDNLPKVKKIILFSMVLAVMYFMASLIIFLIFNSQVLDLFGLGENVKNTFSIDDLVKEDPKYVYSLARIQTFWKYSLSMYYSPQANALSDNPLQLPPTEINPSTIWMDLNATDTPPTKGMILGGGYYRGLEQNLPSNPYMFNDVQIRENSPVKNIDSWWNALSASNTSGDSIISQNLSKEQKYFFNLPSVHAHLPVIFKRYPDLYLDRLFGDSEGIQRPATITHPTLLNDAEKALKYVTFLMPLYGLEFGLMVYYVATAKPWLSIMISIIRNIIVRIPALLITVGVINGKYEHTQYGNIHEVTNSIAGTIGDVPISRIGYDYWKVYPISEVVSTTVILMIFGLSWRRLQKYGLQAPGLNIRYIKNKLLNTNKKPELKSGELPWD